MIPAGKPSPDWLTRVWGGRRLVMWLDNQQVQNVFQVHFSAADFDLRFLRCPQMAQAVLRLSLRSCVQQISRGFFLLTFLCSSAEFVIIQKRHGNKQLRHLPAVVYKTAPFLLFYPDCLY